MPQKLDAQNIEHFLEYYHSALLSYDQEYVHVMSGERYLTYPYSQQKAFILLRKKAAEPHSYPHVSPIEPWVSPWNADIRSQPPKPEPPPTMEIDISHRKENEQEAQETPQRNVEFKDPEIEADGTNGPHVSNLPAFPQQRTDTTDDVDDQSTESESDGETVVQKQAKEIVSLCTTDEERADPQDGLPQRGTPPDTKRYLGRAEQSRLSQPQAQATDPPLQEPTPPRTRILRRREDPTLTGKASHAFLTTCNKSFALYRAEIYYSPHNVRHLRQKHIQLFKERQALYARFCI